MEQTAGQCGGYRYTPSRKHKKTLRSIKKSAKGGSRHRVKKTRRHARKH
jgi:hypothetical protein